MSKFSIIVPVYNIEQYLSKCLDSLTNQTYSDIEIICINDGSTDNCLNILNEYAKSDSRIKIINQENQGLSVARNVGMDSAKGEYILFVDSDDWIELNTCEILSKKIEEHNSPDIIQYMYSRVDDDKILYKTTNAMGKEAVINVLDRPDKSLEGKYWITCWNKAYKNEFLKNSKEYLPTGIKTFEDFIFTVCLYSHNPALLIIDDYLYNWYKGNQNSVTSNNAYTRFIMHKEAWNCLIKKLSDIEYDSLKEISYAEYLKNLMIFKNELYFSEHKQEYINELKMVRKLVKGQYAQTFKILHSCNKFIMMTDLHIYWFYKKIIFPIGKYCFVLPYRKLFKRGKVIVQH